jgi:hypothetical protein
MKKIFFIGSLFLVSFLVSCGGGGGSSTSAGGTGTINAIDGSAMAYAKVAVNSLSDATTSSGTADVNGSLQIPANVTYPAIVRAVSLDGTKANYGYIGSASQANVPVTPMSSLVLAIAANRNPATINAASQLTRASIASAKESVNAIFANIFSTFNVPNGFDILSNSFAANHTGMDLILDSMSITFDDSGNPTLCTKILNVCKPFTLSSLDTSELTLSPSAVTQINSVPLDQCSRMINGLTTASFSTYNANLYSSDFLNSGLGSRDYSAALAAKLGTVNASFHTPIYVGQDDSNNYVFQYFVFNEDSHTYAGTQSMSFKLNGGNCVMVGDQLPFWIQAISQITYYTRVNGTFNGNATPAGMPSVVTNNPINGIYFKAGGDGFGNSAALDNMVTRGSPPVVTGTTIQTLEFSLCDASNTCGSNIMVMQKGQNNNGYYFVPNGVNTIPVVKYSDIGFTTPASFYNGNINPIKVVMKDQSGTVHGTRYLKIKGGFISDAEIQSLTLPSVNNAQAILNTQSNLTNPILDIRIPAGTLIQAASVFSGPNNGTVSGTSVFILSSSNNQTTINKIINVTTDDYRSISLNGSTTSGRPISIKYVFSTVSGSI